MKSNIVLLRRIQEVRQRSRGLYNIMKQKEIDIDWIHGLCKDQGSLEWYNELVTKPI